MGILFFCWFCCFFEFLFCVFGIFLVLGKSFLVVDFNDILYFVEGVLFCDGDFRIRVFLLVEGGVIVLFLFKMVGVIELGVYFMVCCIGCEGEFMLFLLFFWWVGFVKWVVIDWFLWLVDCLFFFWLLIKGVGIV